MNNKSYMIVSKHKKRSISNHWKVYTAKQKHYSPECMHYVSCKLFYSFWKLNTLTALQTNLNECHSFALNVWEGNADKNCKIVTCTNECSTRIDDTCLDWWSIYNENLKIILIIAIHYQTDRFLVVKIPTVCFLHIKPHLLHTNCKYDMCLSEMVMKFN